MKPRALLCVVMAAMWGGTAVSQTLALRVKPERGEGYTLVAGPSGTARIDRLYQTSYRAGCAGGQFVLEDVTLGETGTITALPADEGIEVSVQLVRFALTDSVDAMGPCGVTTRPIITKDEGRASRVIPVDGGTVEVRIGMETYRVGVSPIPASNAVAENSQP